MSKYTDRHIDVVVARLQEYDDILKGTKHALEECRICCSKPLGTDCRCCLFYVDCGKTAGSTRRDKADKGIVNMAILQQLVDQMNKLLEQDDNRWRIIARWGE